MRRFLLLFFCFKQLMWLMLGIKKYNCTVRGRRQSYRGRREFSAPWGCMFVWELTYWRWAVKLFYHCFLAARSNCHINMQPSFVWPNWADSLVFVLFEVRWLSGIGPSLVHPSVQLIAWDSQCQAGRSFLSAAPITAVEQTTKKP